MKLSVKQIPPTRYLKTDKKYILGSSIISLISINFLLAYIGHHYYSQSLFRITSPDFWILILNFIIVTGIVIWNKQVLDWNWSNLGLGKPKIWWQPLFMAALIYGAFNFFSSEIFPIIVELGERPDINHLMVLKGNLHLLIFALILVWITAAFFEEFIFRAYLINSLETLFGESTRATWLAVLVSSVIFGLIHSYQGITGILLTGSMGLIFSTAFILNGRRIWPLILIHGLIDTIGLINIYNLR